ncbi:hypothetical protein R4K55_03825 [Brachyspira alvinipulli]|uniref:hypothetical protein n=1 Tax=Brachyspira alvinipulli TaxID=84379 RepID=UPI0026310884|nr:hypothetical protein [uncultured Brachyspira sp.]
MIFDLIRDLELILSDITFTGINNIDYNVIDKISSISKQFEKIGMNHLKDLLIDLIDSIKTYKTNENKKENIKLVVSNISKIEFYIRNTLSYE